MRHGAGGRKHIRRGGRRRVRLSRGKDGRSLRARDGCSNAYNEKGMQRVFVAHARWIERRIREGDSTGFYAYMKGANLESFENVACSSSETSRGSYCEIRRKSFNDGRATSSRFSTIPHQRSIPRSLIVCRNPRSVMPLVNHLHAKSSTCTETDGQCQGNGA